MYDCYVDVDDEPRDDEIGDGYQQPARVDPLDNYPEVHYYSGRLKVKLDGVHDSKRWSDWIEVEIPATSYEEAKKEFKLQFSGVTTWWPLKKYKLMPWDKE